MARILLIDDHAVVRKGLKAILEEEFGHLRVEEAATGLDGLAKLRRRSVDAVVLDIELPDINGLEVLKRVKRDWPTLPVLVLSMYSESQYEARVLRAGASGYLSKSSAAENLVTALHEVLAGGIYVSSGRSRALAKEQENVADQGPD